MVKKIGVSVPGNRICILAGSANHQSVSCYTMDLSGFKVKKRSCLCDCYEVKLSSKRKAKEEKLVSGERVLRRDHCHGYDDKAAVPPVFESDCGESSFAALDEATMYCISYCEDSKHAHGSETLVQKIRLVDGGGVEVEKCLPMLCRRRIPQTLVLDGKLYVFGGLPPRSQWLLDYEYPWSEVLDPVTGRWEVFTASPPSDHLPVKFYPAVHDSRVFIISPNNGVVYAHTPSGAWQPLVKNTHLLSCTRPVLVGTTIYWLDKTICAYDFRIDAFFRGYFNSYDLDFLTHNVPNDHYCLLHIGGDAEDNIFCLVWENACSNFIHFTRIQITKDYDALEPLDYLHAKNIHASVISCSSMLARDIYRIFHATHVLLLDRFVGGMKQIEPETASKETPNETTVSEVIGASVLKRCKNMSVNSENFLSSEEYDPVSKVNISKKIRVRSEKLMPSAEDIPLRDARRVKSMRSYIFHHNDQV